MDTNSIAYEVDDKERACFMSCLSLAFDRAGRSCIGGGVSHVPRRRVSLRRTQSVQVMWSGYEIYAIRYALLC